MTFEPWIPGPVDQDDEVAAAWCAEKLSRTQNIALSRLARACDGEWSTASGLRCAPVTLRALSDFRRSSRGVLAPLMLARSERNPDTGALEWQITPFGRSVLLARMEAEETGAYRVAFYRAGECRNAVAYDETSTLHTYAEMENGDLWPMCGFGWNRSNGQYFSIFRDSPGTRGDCKICACNIAAGRGPVTDGFPHKTRWL